MVVLHEPTETSPNRYIKSVKHIILLTCNYCCAPINVGHGVITSYLDWKTNTVAKRPWLLLLFSRHVRLSRCSLLVPSWISGLLEVALLPPCDPAHLCSFVIQTDYSATVLAVLVLRQSADHHLHPNYNSTANNIAGLSSLSTTPLKKRNDAVQYSP